MATFPERVLLQAKHESLSRVKTYWAVNDLGYGCPSELHVPVTCTRVLDLYDILKEHQHTGSNFVYADWNVYIPEVCIDFEEGFLGHVELFQKRYGRLVGSETDPVYKCISRLSNTVSVQHRCVSNVTFFNYENDTVLICLNKQDVTKFIFSAFLGHFLS